ncbi:hypothetical protein PXD56_18075 [Maribacter sp. SA7]|uniref:hypothetical protein n=1 Tax=Maribacter zhoushanensis TaxID=3030012 RepID=UPI0023EBC7BC|nr:hypothetical protein [Maribacter zhoushanensis]MDF4204882.1 hypothetical protein [Maribacter zhoushanensis]
MKKSLRKSILTSYIIGLPIGLLFIASIIILPPLLSGEGLLSFIILSLYGKAIVGLVISFIIALWFFGILAQKSIEKGNSLLLTSFKYTLLIILVIWTVFSVIASFNQENEFVFFVLPLIASIFCTTITTFTIGLAIAFRTRTIIRKVSKIKILLQIKNRGNNILKPF